MLYPKLFDKAKSGKIKWWQIETDANKIITSFGYVGSKTTTQVRLVHQGKNIGKTNETTPEEQAILESQSKWQRQVDKGYAATIRSIGINRDYHPMLAQTYFPPWHEAVVSGSRKATPMPVIALGQPKLNGVRCVAVKENNCVKLYSRNMKDYTSVCWDLAKELSDSMVDGDILDGEIYVHGWDFERIISAVKRERHDTSLLEFWAFDYPSIKLSCVRRLNELHKFNYKDLSPRVKVLDYVVLRDTKAVKRFHDSYVRSGYEGLIIRDADADYLWRHRGKELLKYKEFMDEEFRIIGYKSGTGTDDGAICFICHTGGKRNACVPKYAKGSGYFDVRPRGTISDRRDMYKNGGSFVGKMLTVRFQTYSVDKVPIFPVGISIRDYE